MRCVLTSAPRAHKCHTRLLEEYKNVSDRPTLITCPFLRTSLLRANLSISVKFTYGCSSRVVCYHYFLRPIGYSQIFSPTPVSRSTVVNIIRTSPSSNPAFRLTYISPKATLTSPNFTSPNSGLCYHIKIYAQGIPPPPPLQIDTRTIFPSQHQNHNHARLYHHRNAHRQHRNRHARPTASRLQRPLLKGQLWRQWAQVCIHLRWMAYDRSGWSKGLHLQRWVNARGVLGY